jgi:hypothetical protein
MTFLFAPDTSSAVTLLESAAGLARARERLQEYKNSIASPSKALWCDLNRFIPCLLSHASQYLAAVLVRKVLRTMFSTSPKMWKTKNCRQWVSYCKTIHLKWHLHRPAWDGQDQYIGSREVDKYAYHSHFPSPLGIYKLYTAPKSLRYHYVFKNRNFHQ